jgi:hypothetical protein
MANDKLPARSSNQDVDHFLRKVARTPLRSSSSRGRLIFALDATASRQPTWDQACALQGEMFAETAALGGLDIQLAWYRGAGEFRATTWANTADQLVKSMNDVYCMGGLTQIERVLNHAIGETRRHRINALVFIGDCVEENVDKLCHAAGELGVLGVPIFLFHEGREPGAASAFRQLARLSHGAYCCFDSGSAKQLRELLAAVAVYAAGGKGALEEFGRRRGGLVQRLTHQLGKE